MRRAAVRNLEQRPPDWRSEALETEIRVSPTRPKRKPRPVIGWREWVALPELGVSRVKAKVDTGARTAALHAHRLEVLDEGNGQIVRFEIHPTQRSAAGAISTTAKVVDWRDVRSSAGHRERRPVIVTPLRLRGQQWNIEVTLTNRDAMGFRLLLGRQSIRGRFVVDPGRSFLTKENEHA